MLMAESYAVRFHTTKEKPLELVRTKVPVKLEIKVAAESFKTLLEMIVHKYQTEHFNVEQDSFDFYPFDIHFEYATPTDFQKRHHPSFRWVNQGSLGDGFKPFEGSMHSDVYGYPTQEGISGQRHVFENPEESEVQKFALVKQNAPSCPQLYLSFRFNKHADGSRPDDTLKESVMEVQLSACFIHREFEVFDDYFKNAENWEHFLRDFDEYFKTHITASKWGDVSAPDHYILHTTPLNPQPQKTPLNVKSDVVDWRVLVKS
jgi:hypothetical protein